MKFTFSALVTALTLFSWTAAQLPESTNLTGIVGSPGWAGASSMAPRQALNVLQGNADLFNMYVLGLRSLMATGETLDESYYGVCGIHGRPYVRWQRQGTTSSLGFCTHRSVIFVNWHRPYLVLFEQLLTQHAIRQANRFPAATRSRWLAAARRVRQPYWDWAATNQRGIPSIMAVSTIQVFTPTSGNSRVSIPNPLFNYRFQRTDIKTRYFPSNFQDATTRRSSSASTNMVNSYNARRQQVYDLFSIGRYSRFSSTRFSDGSVGSSIGSVEAVHDMVHGTIGGHMGQVPVAAFDPIFWLHHCNVDRLATIWQAINPRSLKTNPAFASVEPLQSQFGTMGYPGGIREDLNTPLWPFRTRTNRRLTSADFSTARGIWAYGYEYPEVPQSNSGMTDTQLAQFARGRVESLYAPARSAAPNTVNSAASDTTPARVQNVNAPAASDEAVTANSGNGETKTTEWTYYVVMNANDLPFTYTVYFTCNNKDLSGVTSFSMTGGGTGGESLISGTVPVTPDMLEMGQQPGAPNAADWLTNNCKWNVRREDGTVVPTNSVPSLEVSCASNELTSFDDPNKLAVKGLPVIHPEITRGKTGGLSGNRSKYMRNTAVVSGTT